MPDALPPLDMPATVVAAATGNTAVPAPNVTGAVHAVSYPASGGSPATATIENTQMVQVTLAGGNGIGVLISTGPGQQFGLALGACVYYRVYPGWVVTVISLDANAGTCWITECA